jgi:hypothetical protein
MHHAEDFVKMNWQPLDDAMAGPEWLDAKRTRLFLHRCRGG